MNILGTDYEIILNGTEKDDVCLEECDGYCDYTVKKIVVKKIIPEKLSLGDLEYYEKKVLRHEILHAYLFESGLRENSNEINSWAMNEEMIDWFALQFPKILKTYKELGVEE